MKKTINMCSLLCPQCSGFLDVSIQVYSEIVKYIYYTKDKKIKFGNVLEKDEYVTYALQCDNSNCDFQKYCETSTEIKEFVESQGNIGNYSGESGEEIVIEKPDFTALLVRRGQL